MKQQENHIYKFGNTTVVVIPPPPMTQEEIDAVLAEASAVTYEIYRRAAEKEQNN